ncbi:MAG: FAD-dependent thymidylate synthase [Candidatus Aenigmarchaeota archaeon]|nr:FAD-dependent thymidylate synthase [Candidatus Aenigmarchaeota archaeon]
MTKKELIGKTSFGGKIYYLYSEEPYVIPATRIFVSMGIPIEHIIPRNVKTTERAFDYFSKHPEKAKEYVKFILGFHHGDIGEMGYDGLYLKDVSRLFTLVGWLPIGATRGIQGVGTERSLRYVRVGKNPYIKTKDKDLRYLQSLSEELYSDLIEDGIPKEDARYFLPLSTKTEEILQIPFGREINKWSNYLLKQPFKEAREIGRVVKEFNEERTGFRTPIEEYPKLVMPIESEKEDRKINELEKLLYNKKVLYDKTTETLLMYSRRSIASFHQDIRNRQVYFYPVSWERVLNDALYIPHTVKNLMKKDDYFEYWVNEVVYESQEIYSDFWYDLDKEDILAYPLLLGNKIDIFGRINGNENIQYTVMLRSCMRAQTEIRTFYRLVASKIQKDFPLKLGARCEVEYRCYEPGKENCPLYKKYVLNFSKSV